MPPQADLVAILPSLALAGIWDAPLCWLCDGSHRHALLQQPVCIEERASSKILVHNRKILKVTKTKM